MKHIVVLIFVLTLNNSNNVLAQRATMNWISDEQIEKVLIEKSVASLKRVQLLFCISSDFEHAILLRRHAAWEIQGQGWRDSNSAPDTNEEGRWVLNFTNMTGKMNLVPGLK